MCLNKKCVKCGYIISGVFYGAGDGSGLKFICSGCYWEQKYNDLKLTTDNLKRKIKELYESC